jgi:hypothetical protein
MALVFHIDNLWSAVTEIHDVIKSLRMEIFQLAQSQYQLNSRLKIVEGILDARPSLDPRPYVQKDECGPDEA